MSVLIRGISMPTHCMDCPFMVSRDNDDCILQSAEANENFENWEQMKSGCPLVPVPPHERLINADELRLVLWKRAKEFSNSEYGEGVKCGLADAREYIKIAPTIIPAEPAEEG